MNDQEKLRVIEDARRLVRELNEWADEMISSGASEAEQELVRKTLLRLADLKQALKNLRDQC
jgi:type IV secretory pathway ATPase VirB11/archaellum biosynthesis ATPase